MKELICSRCGDEWDYNHELHGMPMATTNRSFTVPYLSVTATSASSSTDEARAEPSPAKETPPDDASWELT